MITTCPHCQTAFQISAEQLSAKAGLVRCGACRQVFNGYRGLTLASPAATDPAPAAERSTQAPADAPAAETQASEPSHSALLLPLEATDASVPAAIAQAEALLADEPAPQQTLDLDLTGDAPALAWPPEAEAPPARAEARAEELAAQAVQEKLAAQVVQEELAAQVVSPRATEPLYRPELHVPRTSSAWLAASALMLALLALQCAYFWRGEIAREWPPTRAYLEDACASVGCAVPLAQELAQLNIEASTLEADPARPGIVVLQTTLQNVAPFVQRYPHLELTLTGVNDDVLGIKTFAPDEYLPNEQDLIRGWPPQQTRAVALHLDVSALPPAGFRLRLLYP